MNTTRAGTRPLIALTGATGFVGSEIARELVRQGHSLRVLVRKTSKLDGLKGLEYERFEGDILDGDEDTRNWAGLVEDRAWYADYQAKTARRIPLVGLPETRPA